MHPDNRNVRIDISTCTHIHEFTHTNVGACRGLIIERLGEVQ